jgi:ParB-like chromosome segregation protein Spo0J
MPLIDESRNTTRMVPLDDLVPHPLNANVMPDEMLAKLKAHIKRTGRYPHLIVRPHPRDAGKFQVLDGHHRIRVLRDLGHREARCDVWDVDDRETKILLATLNRLEGQDEPFRRAQLIHELLGEMRSDDLAGLLPEDESQIADLHALLEFPADEIADQLARQAEEDEKTLPVVMTFVVLPQQAETILRAVEAASDGITGRDRKARGLLNLAKAFLETHDASGSPAAEEA